MSETSAGQLRRDLALLTIVLGAEAGRAPEVPTQGLRTATGRVAALSRAAASVLPPIILRAERATGLPFGRMFRVVDVLQTDSLITQIYIVKDKGKGYRILDALGTRDPAIPGDPISQKFTQLADVQPRPCGRT